MEDPTAAAAAVAAAAEAAAAAKVPSAWAPAEAALSAKAAASAATAAQLEKAGQDLATLNVQPEPAVEKPTPLERMNFDQLYASVLPPRETAQRVEECRRRLEWVVQKKWRDASVAVYGSAGSGLSLGSVSDIDLCVHLPAILRAKEQTAAATAALDAAKAEAPATAALLDELSRAQTEVARVKQLLGRANAERNPANAASLDQRLAAASATVTELTEEVSNSDEHRSVINTLQPLDVEVKRLARAQIDDKRLVYMLANALRASGYTKVEPIAHARTPVIKCVYRDVYGTTDLDVVVNNGLAVHNTALLRAYLDVSAYTRQFIVLVKLWASRRGVNKAAEGTLSSYGHVLSAIHFLQAGVDPPMLPDLQDTSFVAEMRNKMDPKWQFYDGIDCRFGDPRSWTPPRQALGMATPPGMAKLLLQYFEYMLRYGVPGGEYTLAVRARGRGQAGFLLRKEEAWPTSDPNKREALRDRLSIEDPFETHDSPNPNRRHDVARSLASQKGKAARLVAEWERARDILAERVRGKRPQVARLFERV